MSKNEVREMEQTTAKTAAELRIQYRLQGRREGREARLDGVKRADCPYDRRTALRREWIKGWRMQNNEMKGRDMNGKPIVGFQEVGAGVYFIAPTTKQDRTTKVKQRPTNTTTELHRIYRQK
jgi:ribosome modulation factor